MKLLLALGLVLILPSWAFGKAKVIYVKGEAIVTRHSKNIVVKKGLLVNHGDTITTGESGLVIIKSKASTYKVSRNSNLLLDLKNQQIINSKLNYGSIVVEFMREKLEKSEKATLVVKSRAASFGVRGTKFFAFVDKSKDNAIISVEHGEVAFKGVKSKEPTLVNKKSSSMTNINKKSIDARAFGFENKVNWNLSTKSTKLRHPKSLFTELGRLWNEYKKENTKKWSRKSDEMKNKWKEFGQ